MESGMKNEQPWRCDLIQTFRSLSQRLNDKNIEDVWDMVYFMAGGGAAGAANEPQLDSAPNEESEQAIDRSSAPQMQAFFVAQAVSYLERCFREIVQAKVSANLKQARLGGQIGTLALVSAYLRLSVSEKCHVLGVEKFDAEISGGQQQLQPLWATIYLCLRCGDPDAARLVALKVILLQFYKMELKMFTLDTF